jgi:hypothetical protein
MARQLETVEPTRSADAVVPAIPPSREIEVIVVSPGGMFDAPSLEVGEPAKPDAKAKAQPHVSQKDVPAPTVATKRPSDPRPDRAPSAVPHKSRTGIWLLLLMLALGIGAMAAAYFWPADL